MARVGSAAWMQEAWGDPCKPDLAAMAIYAGGPRFQCDRRAREAFTQLGAIFLRHGYVVRSVGGYNCRKITGGNVPSNHSWGTAIDVNEATNPYRRDRLITDMPAAMIAEIEALTTSTGTRVFRWGGRYSGNKDAMHFEVIATPLELAAGFIVQVGEPARVGTWPVIRRGAIGSAVVELQRVLHMERTTGTGTFGPRTEAAVKLYQELHGLEVDGIVGAATWTALLSAQPPLVVAGIGPQKRVA